MTRRREKTEWGVAMGERLQELRQAAGMSQTELADATGIPVGSLRNWERGRRKPTLDAAAKLATAIGCTLGQLAGTEPMPKKGGKR
jgi:transcriptional regulator with XRE-family HTH domain